MKNQKTLKCIVSVILIALISGLLMCVNAQPQGGDWKIQTEFGEMALTVSPEGTSITKLSVTFSDYTCGGVTQNGTVSQQNAAGWSISDNQFSITTTINPSGTIRITVAGTFSQAGNKASGNWNFYVSGTNCSGTWNHTLSNGTIPEGSWESIGPYMGQINAMAMDNARPDTVYAATPNGLYKTVDGAENWFVLDLPNEEMKTVTVSQSHSNQILCTTEYKVFKSADYGNSWETIWSDTMKVTCAVFNPENPGTIYAGTDEYVGGGQDSYTEWIYRSLDGGNTWAKIYFEPGLENRGLKYVKRIVIDPSDTTKIYVGGANNSIKSKGCIFSSQDNGNTWNNIKLTTCSREEIKAMICTPSGYENHRVCAIVDGCKTNRQFFISSDYGITWQEFNVPSSFDINGNSRDNAIYISEDFPQWIYMGARYKYEDKYASVVAFNIEDEKWYYYNKTPSYYPTSFLTNNRVDYLGFSTDGVYKYMGNYNWLPKNKGFGNIQIYDLVSYPNDPEKLMVSAGSLLAKTTNSGNTWTKLSRPSAYYNTNFIALNHKDTSMIFTGITGCRYRAVIDYFKIYKSIDGGISWSSHNMFMTQGVYDYQYLMWMGDILIFPGKPDRILCGVDGGGGSGEGLYLSTNGGSYWSSRFNTGVSAIAMDPAYNNIVYAGTTNLGYVFRSTDQGSNWTRISPAGDGAFVTNVWDIEADKNSRVFAATSSGLYTWEGGETWSLVLSFPTTNTSVIAIDNTTEVPVYYVGTSGQGVFVSSDGGSTWESFNDGLDRKNITKLKISDSSPKYLYAGTSNGGVWVTRLEETSTGYSSFQKPEHSFTIFPNPNKGLFYFRLNSNPPERIAIKLVNSLGQVIETRILPNPSVNQTESFNVSHLSAGVYHFFVISDKLRDTRKIVIQ